MATAEADMGMSLSMMPPWVVALVAFWCFLATSKDYRVRLVCPQWDYDRWVVMEHLELTLHEVMNTFWDYECPTHGPQRRMPFQGEEKKFFHHANIN